MGKLILFLSLTLFILCMFLMLCCDLYFPPASFNSPLPEPTIIPTPWPAPTAVPTPTIPPDGNLIYNHDFSNGLDSWTFWAHEAEGTIASVAEISGVAVITITDGRDTQWYVQFQQKYLPVELQKTYRITFNASAASPKNIYVEVGEDGYDNNNDGNKYTAYGSQSINLTASMDNYSWDLTMSQATDQKARLVFNLGGNNEDVWIDNVTLTEIVP